MKTLKLKNQSKNRNATANEIAKTLIIDRLEGVLYFEDCSDYGKAYNQDFLNEIHRHIGKHIDSITKKLNPNNDRVEKFY